MFDKARGKTGCFKGEGGKRGERQETAFLLPNGPLRREKGGAKSKNQGSGEGKKGVKEGETGTTRRKNWGSEPKKRGAGTVQVESAIIDRIFSPYYIYRARRPEGGCYWRESLAYPLRRGPKTTIHPSRWSQDGFGTERRTSRSAFPTPHNQHDQPVRRGSKVG